MSIELIPRFSGLSPSLLGADPPHDSTHRRVVVMNLPLTALWPTYVAVESLPWILNLTALWPDALAVVRNMSNSRLQQIFADHKIMAICGV